MTHYKLNDCTKLPNIIDELRIIHSNIINLDGLEVPNLNDFELSYCKQLKNIKFNSEHKKNLKTLEINCCKKIENYEILSELENLEKLIISDSAPIPSLKFIQKMPNLKFLSFVNTNILDGDLSSLINLKYAGFDNKRHYSHKMEEIKKLIAEI